MVRIGTAGSSLPAGRRQIVQHPLDLRALPADPVRGLFQNIIGHSGRPEAIILMKAKRPEHHGIGVFFIWPQDGIILAELFGLAGLAELIPENKRKS